MLRPKYNFVLVMIILLMLSACSEEETPTPTSAAEDEPTAVVEPASGDEDELPAGTVEKATEEPSGEAQTFDVDDDTIVMMERDEEPIYLSVIWHQHQPIYFKDPETGIYSRPWVRVHATKDYVDMVKILEDYPDVKATFNLTPSLIRQLDDLASGAKDLYWVLAEIQAEELSNEEKQVILDRFFDTNRRIIARFPRYQQLLDLRDGSDDPLSVYDSQDFLDLQVLFNLAWTDPDWLAQEPLKPLVDKGQDFNEEDKQVLFGEHERLIREVIPAHRQLQESGQIEVTMTPYAHPILPLLVNSDLAAEALPEIELPSPRFVYGQDAVAQVELGVQFYEDHFGVEPKGMWPAEGAVAQETISMVAQNGIEWMASDEGVLANSLGLDSFSRNSSEVVVEADELYRPYYVEGRSGGPVAMVFRDVLISDRVGFMYSGMDGEEAAADFIKRIHAIRDQLQESGAEGAHLVSVILDGENAWEYYENDGKEFLHSLYKGLSDDPLIQTVTPSEFLDLAPEQPAIEDLWAGSWISHDYSTWIGEEEENRAWEYLLQTRDFLQPYITGSRQSQVSDEALAEALEHMYAAEGSDWFWWYGSDQESSNDSSFDHQYRSTLKQVYAALGQEAPTFLDVPIIPEQAVAADQTSTELIGPEIDGIITGGEWDSAGFYQASGGAMAASEPIFNSLAYGFDSNNLYLKLDFQEPTGEKQSFEIYLDVPGSGPVGSFSRSGSLLGFPANRAAVIEVEDGEILAATLLIAGDKETWTEDVTQEIQAAYGDNSVEVGIPLSGLGSADSGDRFTIRAFYNDTREGGAVALDMIPGAGPAVVVVPDLGRTTVLADILDPAGDDFGPGSYTYPMDPVFKTGSYDILNFQVGFDDENIVFRFETDGPIDNSWDSPNGLSIQTFDVYIDKDGDGAGGSAMLPGRNLAFDEGTAWDFVVTVEGWFSGVYIQGEEGVQQVAEASEFTVLTNPDKKTVTIRIPKGILGSNPEKWAFAAAVLSQEGFPSGGVMRVRDVLPAAEQYRIGGAPVGATNHTRVIDLVWPEENLQAEWLSDFEPTTESQANLTADDFAIVPMFRIGD